MEFVMHIVNRLSYYINILQVDIMNELQGTPFRILCLHHEVHNLGSCCTGLT